VKLRKSRDAGSDIQHPKEKPGACERRPVKVQNSVPSTRVSTQFTSSFVLCPKMARGPVEWPPRKAADFTLFHVDSLAVWIERAVDANSLAFILFYQVLSIHIISSATGVLQHVLVAGLLDRAREDLALRRLRVRLGVRSLLSRLIRRLGWWFLLLSGWLRLRGAEVSTRERHAK
jgi:hypothetical protein